MSTSKSAIPSPSAYTIEPGKAAPSLTLKDQHGQVVKLKDFKGRWLVVYFYPKDDTTGCTAQACSFRDSREEYDRRGVAVVGISPDDEKSHQRFAQKHTLPFQLLADTQRTACEAYGVWQQKSMYGRKYMGVVRTTYLIDPKGIVAHRWDKVKVPGHERDVLATFDALA